METKRSGAQAQVADLLRTAKSALGLSVAFLTRMDGERQHFEIVETSAPLPASVAVGIARPRETSLCQAILDGKLPAVIPDVTAYPAVAALAAERYPGFHSYVSVPVVLSDGTLYGTFCAAGSASDNAVTLRDRALMDVLAHAASVIIEPGVRLDERAAEISGRLDPVVANGGPVVVLQPIVDLATGTRIGAEALSRFPAEWAMTPDLCFAEAHSVGLGHRLELLALERAAEHLDHVTGYVALNISPATLLTPAATDLLRRLPADRVLLELSEHDQVTDYDALTAVLAPLRAAGLRLAVDDVGAGFSSLRHIVLTSPDVLKLDRSIVDGISRDPVLTTLVRSMVAFGHDCGATVVAEGVETAEDCAAILALGVDHGQGWYFGRPGPREALADEYAVGLSRRTG